MNDFDFEPIRGLPAELPPGERLLWQGAPRWGALATSAFHVRKVAVYFALLMLWQSGTALLDGAGATEAALAAAWMGVLGGSCLALLLLLAWLMARTTVYSITSARVLLRFGIAITITVDIPFDIIRSAALRSRADGSGDIPLALSERHRVSYFVMWPHVRPRMLRHPQPMLRALSDAEAAADILAAALATPAPSAPVRAIALEQTQPETAPPLRAAAR